MLDITQINDRNLQAYLDTRIDAATLRASLRGNEPYRFQPGSDVLEVIPADEYASLMRARAQGVRRQAPPPITEREYLDAVDVALHSEDALLIALVAGTEARLRNCRRCDIQRLRRRVVDAVAAVERERARCEGKT